MKTILYGHAWLSGALTGFAFFGFVRAFNTPRQVWIWAAVVAVGLLWTFLGFAYVARRDGEGGGGDDLEGPVPASAGRPAEEVAGASRLRGTPARHAASLLMLMVFVVVAVLLAAAAGGWWATTSRPPRPFVNPTGAPRPPRFPGRG